MSNDPLNNFPIILYDPKQGREIPETYVNSSIDEYADYALFGDNIEITGSIKKLDSYT